MMVSFGIYGLHVHITFFNVVNRFKSVLRQYPDGVSDNMCRLLFVSEKTTSSLHLSGRFLRYLSHVSVTFSGLSNNEKGFFIDSMIEG